MKSILIFILATTFPICLFSQENTAHQWFFGEYCGVDFSHGVPYGITGGQITGWEGCATVGDMNGNLLFYTDGQVIYDRNHDVMENGTGLMGHWSSAQSSIIIRVPGSNDKFYVFTTDDSAIQHLANGWRYSVVDMTQNGGLGAVTEIKNVLLEDMVGERQVAIMHGNNVNVWIVGHRWNSNEFLAYEISADGISEEPVVSALGTVHEGGYSPNPEYNGWTNAVGFMKTTIAGDKIALSIQILGRFELFDFDKSTGVVSNCHTSPYLYAAYGVEFSPDGKKLYTVNDIYATSKVYQWDLTQTDPFTNPVLIESASTQQNRGIQLAPNGKLYLTKYTGNYLSEINYPDEDGADCGFEANAVYLQGEQCRSGLPSIFFYKGFHFFTGSEVNLSICAGDSVFLENAYRYTTGTYYDTVESYLGWDSIVNTHLIVQSGSTAPIITEFEGVLTASTGLSYQWYLNGNPIFGATSQQYQPLQTGNYSVVVDFNDVCPGLSTNYYFIFTDIGAVANRRDFEIYPNPFADILRVSMSDIYALKIFDSTGRLMLEKSRLNGMSELNTENLSAGIYLIQIISGKKIMTRKIIKE
ncbi:MAG TPA: T9SS type A sorting domain-containing protein [Bacteroidales bacterium]|nr:T9SS type A sorting domain-containing protein [Bacteroidales bacterium]